MKTFQRYLFRESLFPVLSSVFVVAGILIVARLVKIMTLVINRGLAITELLRLLALFAPSFLEVAVPMGLMLGILVAFHRLAVDGELVGAQACGLGRSCFLRPTLVLAAVGMILTGTFSLLVRPESRSALVTFIEDLGRRRASAALQEQVFFDQLPGLVLYADRIEERGKLLAGVFVADTRAPQKRTSIVARRGYLITASAKHDSTVLRLEDGLVFTWQGTADNFEVTQFQVLDWDLSDSSENTAGSRTGTERDLKAVPTRELLSSLNVDVLTASSLLLELNRRLATPVACLMFALVALAWSLRRISPLPTSVALSTGCFVGYYVLESFGDALLQRFPGLLVAVGAAWMPTLAFGCLALLLWPSSPALRKGAPWRGTYSYRDVSRMKSAPGTHIGHS